MDQTASSVSIGIGERDEVAARSLLGVLLRQAEQTSSRPQDDEGHSISYAAEIFIRFSAPILNCHEEWLAQRLLLRPDSGEIRSRRRCDR